MQLWWNWSARSWARKTPIKYTQFQLVMQLQFRIHCKVVIFLMMFSTLIFSDELAFCAQIDWKHASVGRSAHEDNSKRIVRTAMPMHRDWTMNVNVYYTQQSIINIFELMIPLSEMSMLRWQIRYICRRFIGTRQSFIIFGMGFGCVYVVHLNSHRPLNVYILLANCAIVIQ